MKKIKLYTSLILLSSAAMPAVATLASCGGQTTTTIKSIPEEMLNIQSNILLGLKDTASIDGYDTLLIPENVVYIEKEAFKDAFVKDTNSCSIKTVIFNKKLRSVGSKAFEGCTNLTCLDFSNLTDIRLMSLIFEDGTVFANCSNESGAIKLPDGITDTQTEWVKTEFKNAGLPTSWFGDKDPQHKITTSTLVEKTGITADIETLTEKNEVNVTINNARSTSIVDANLTIKVADQHINVPFEGYLAPGANTVTYTKQSIQALFPSYTIQYNDAISFTLVRSGAYEVKNNQLYQFDDFGESSLVSEDDIKALDQKFLVKDSETSDLVLSSKTYVNFVNSLTDDATIYLIYGDFKTNNGVSARKSIRLTIHGICNSQGVAYPAIYAYSTEVEAVEGFIHYDNVELNLFNLNVKGRPNDGTKSWVSDLTTGIIATPKPSEDPSVTNNIEITATNCAYTGAYTACYHHAVYNNCTFDSTNSIKPTGTAGQYKNNYPMYIYSAASAEFHNCTFTSVGKAIKVYCDGQLSTVTEAPVITVDSCTFNLRDTTTCCEWEFPINIDSRLYTTTGVKVNYNNCSMNSVWITAKGDKLYGITDTKDAEGYYEHVLINGNKVKE